MSTVPAVLVLVLRDVAATYPLPVVTDPIEFDDNTECVWITSDGSSKAGIVVNKTLPFPERLSDAANQVADWLIESLPAAGYSAVWPDCPLHHNAHPLEACATSSGAEWVCPQEKQPLAAVGGLLPS